MGRAVIPEPLRNLARLAKKQDWTIERTKGHHIRWTSPTGAVVLSGSTPGDWRNMKNVRAQLRNAGLVIE